MPFTLITGTFHAVGYAPDGDSIRFHRQPTRTTEHVERFESQVERARPRPASILTLSMPSEIHHTPLSSHWYRQPAAFRPGSLRLE